jgi:tripartite-type tricarboxylate transporter receptor subunit TctC
MVRGICFVLAVLTVLAALAGGARADAVADFYAGKQVTLIVATPPGGPYDLNARLLASHLARHIPGHPAIVVQNMQGASGMLAANYLANRAPQDGTVIANLHNMLPLAKVLGRLTVDVDPAALNWLGNMTRETGDVVVSARSPVKTIDDAKRDEVIIGAESPLALASVYPHVMNRVLGTKFRVVLGYAGFADIQNAFERGEVDGIAGDTWYAGAGPQYQWYKAGTIRILLQIGNKSPDLGDLPLLTDLASNDDDRRLLELFSSPYTVGKPTAVGPHVPPDRVAALRQAYDATLADPALLADAAKLGITIAPVSGAELTAFIRQLEALPEALVIWARATIAP